MEQPPQLPKFVSHSFLSPFPHTYFLPVCFFHRYEPLFTNLLLSRLHSLADNDHSHLKCPFIYPISPPAAVNNPWNQSTSQDWYREGFLSSSCFIILCPSHWAFVTKSMDSLLMTHHCSLILWLTTNLVILTSLSPWHVVLPGSLVNSQCFNVTRCVSFFPSWCKSSSSYSFQAIYSSFLPFIPLIPYLLYPSIQKPGSFFNSPYHHPISAGEASSPPYHRTTMWSQFRDHQKLWCQPSSDPSVHYHLPPVFVYKTQPPSVCIYSFSTITFQVPDTSIYISHGDQLFGITTTSLSAIQTNCTTDILIVCIWNMSKWPTIVYMLINI